MIKKIVLALVLLTTLSSAASINWEKSIRAAITKGKKEHKPVMVLINRDGCKWCSYMKANTLSDEQVVKTLNRDFISAQGHTNRGDVPRDFLTRGTPATWFIKDGEPMYQPLPGAIPVDQYLEALKIISQEYKSSKK